MKTVYLIRHGESVVNLREGIFVDEVTAPLTEVGEQQSRFLAERAAKLKIDVVISSPFERTKRTAQFITEMTGHIAEYEPLFAERLLPIDILGKSKSDPEMRTLVDKAMRSSERAGSAKVGRTETFEEIKARAARALTYLERRPESDILVVGHGFFTRMLIAYMLYGETLDTNIFDPFVWGLRTRNTGMSVVRFDPTDAQRHWWLLVWNDHAHLG